MIHLFDAIVCYSNKAPCIALRHVNQGKQIVSLSNGRVVTFYIELFEGITYIDNIRDTTGDIPSIIAEEVRHAKN